MAEDFYTAELSKGQGILQETLALLREWQPGMTQTELYDTVLATGILGKATAQRTKDVVLRCFASRFLKPDDKPARYLKCLVEKGRTASELAQVFLIYAARTNRILHDFITQVYWPDYGAGIEYIDRDDSRQFIAAALDQGRMASRWSESTQSRIARYLLSTMAEFGMLEAGRLSRREIQPYAISTLTVLFLAHELHFAGCGDNGLVGHPDWRLFGLTRRDVVRQLDRAGRQGAMIVQDSGEMARIAWGAKSMEEFLYEFC
jgi:hypothetical protein